MRLRRSVPDGETCAVADVVLQLGENKIPLKAERLLGAAVRVSGNPDREQLHTHPTERTLHSSNSSSSNNNNNNIIINGNGNSDSCNNEDEEKAIEALTRMQAALSAGAASTGKWNPWSPDDLYPYHRQPYPSPTLVDSSHILDISPQEAANAPAYYDAAEQPYYIAQQTSASAIRDMALHKGAPTIFDNLGEPATPKRQRPSSSSMKQHTRRSKTFGHGSRPRKLDLVQLFPQHRPSTSRMLSPSRQSNSPTTVTGRTDYPLPPLPNEAMQRGSRRSNTTAGGSGNSNTCDDFDKHKLNIRRPPKGIQNWFDAYLESEDEEADDDFEEIEEEEEEEQVRKPHPGAHELPADDILPPAYSAPMREISRISEKSSARSLSVDPSRDDRRAIMRVAERDEMHRYRDQSDSNSWDSIQSSHIGRIPPHQAHPDLETNTFGAQSVLSLSESPYEDEQDEDEDEDDDEDEDENDNDTLPSIRDSIWGDRNVVVGSASSVGVHKIQRPPRLQNMKSFVNESRESIQSSRSSKGTPATQRRDMTNSTPPPTRGTDSTSEQTALAKLNGFSSESQTTTSGDTALQEAVDPANVSPMDVAHMMAVTDEEKMFLDLMRRKRVAMQQMSFTEGYQMALKSEQQRLAKRTALAEMKALKALRRQKELERQDSQMSGGVSPTRSLSEADIRRQLSALRKEQVDESFQIERFLGVPQAQATTEQVAHEHRKDSQVAELLPASVYSPHTTTPGNSPAVTQSSFHSSEEQATLEDVQKKVKYFIAANGAVPPLHMAFKTMRRKSTRHATSMPPASVVEEEQSPPEIPSRSPERHKRGDSNSSTVNELHHKISSVSMDDEPRDKSPIYPPSRNDSVSQAPLPLVYTRAQTSPVISNLSGPVSPFSQIIHSAAAKGRQSSSSAGGSMYTPDTDMSQISELPPGIKRLPPPMTSHPALRNQDARGSSSSSVSNTSAGEAVLAAWAELGGGQLEVTAKQKKKGSGKGREF